jgi:hypothetical protein
MTDRRSPTLLPVERETLPLLPLILCAKVEGAIAASEALVILEAMRTLGISEAGIKHVYDLMEKTHLEQDELAQLYLLRELLEQPNVKDKGLTASVILEWSARVCAAYAEAEEDDVSAVSEREAVLLHTIGRLLGLDDLTPMIPWLESLIQEKIPSLTRLEVQSRLAGLLDTLSWEDPVPAAESLENPPQRNPFGMFGELLPIQGIPFAPREGVQVARETFLRLLARSISISRGQKEAILRRVPTLEQEKFDQLIEIFQEEELRYRFLAPKNYAQVRHFSFDSAMEWLALHEAIMSGASRA